MYHKNGMICAIGLALSVLIGSSSACSAELGDTDVAIKLTKQSWTGQVITTQLASELLKKAGYKTELIAAGEVPQFIGLADGTLDASLEVWAAAVAANLKKAIEAKQVESLGPLGLNPREGWIYPKFMEKLCPGLPDWHALEKPECIQALATPDTLPNGRVLDYPADWGVRSESIIADNNLPLTAVRAGSEGALIAELRAADAAKRPLLMPLWSPHYIFSQIEVGWVDMPPCPSNDNARCFLQPRVFKVVSSSFSKKWPVAYKLLKNFELPATEQEAMMFRVDQNHEQLPDVVSDWMDKHEAVWKPWIDDAMK